MNSLPSAVSRKILPLPAPLLDKEGLGEVLSSVKNPPRSPLGKGGRKQDDLSGNGTSARPTLNPWVFLSGCPISSEVGESNRGSHSTPPRLKPWATQPARRTVTRH